jgi:hypothetical protein
MSCQADIVVGVGDYLEAYPESFLIGIPIARSRKVVESGEICTEGVIQRFVCSSKEWNREAEQGRGAQAIHRLRLLDEVLGPLESHFGFSSDTPPWDAAAGKHYAHRFEEFKRAAKSIPLDVKDASAARWYIRDFIRSLST